MQRSIMQDLQTWQNSPHRKPLILQGARQVGKTYILKEFGRQSYEQMVYLNFESQPKIHAYFSGDLNPKKIIQDLALHFGLSITPEKTLLIFDEIQECPQALSSLKYFCEENPEYSIAAAGSLLGVKLSPTGFPVGKVDLLNLYPMTFFEFLSAIHKQSWRDFCEKITAEDAINPSLHDELMSALRQYMVIGGMPEAVSIYQDTQDYQAVRTQQETILRTYELDFAKHAPPNNSMKISQLWHAVPSQLAKENKKFMFNAIRPSARAREYESSIEWLNQAGMIHQVYQISTPSIPLDAYCDKNAFKVYALDVGLLGAMSELPPRVILDPEQIFEEFKGAFTENYVLQELIAAKHKNLYYWTSEGRAELDFIIQHELKAYPLEVKAGVSKHKKSLMVYQEKFKPSQLSRATAMNLKKEDNLLNYPLYLISRFPF